MANVKIEMTGRLTGKVWIDGEEVTELTSIEFRAALPDQPAQVVLVRTIHPESLELLGYEVDVTVLDNSGSQVFRQAGK